MTLHVPRPCVFWSLRLASVGIWETGLEGQPVQGPCHCTEIVFPAPPLLFSVTASARGWRSRGWSPLPFLDLLCGFTAVASLLAPQHHDWKKRFNFYLVGKSRGENARFRTKEFLQALRSQALAKRPKGFALTAVARLAWLLDSMGNATPPWASCFLRSQWAPVIE